MKSVGNFNISRNLDSSIVKYKNIVPMKFFKIKIILFLLPLLLISSIALAGDPTIDPGIPGGRESNASPTGLVANLYQFAIMIGGLLAFAAIVYGAVRYTIAAGNSGNQSEGKEWIRQAILGLILLLGAYLILNVINPDLITLDLPTLEPIQVPVSTYTPTTPPQPNASTTVTPTTSNMNCIPRTTGMGTCRNCRNSPALEAVLSCLSNGNATLRAIRGSIGFTFNGQHTCNAVEQRVSCHFGGTGCTDGAHAFDVGRSGLTQRGLNVPIAAAALNMAAMNNEGCGGISRVRCELGSQSVDCSIADHIHVNVANAPCGCN